jgi:hypothetical protein
LLARHCPRTVLADLPDPVVGGATTAELRATTIRLRIGSLCVRLASPTLDVPSGPAIVLVAGLGYLASVLFGPGDSLRALYFRRGRLEA